MFAIITPALIAGAFAERVRFGGVRACSSRSGRCSSTRRWRTGCGAAGSWRRRASARSTSPAAPSCTSAPARPRWPRRCSSAGAGATRREHLRPAQRPDGGARRRHPVVRVVRVQRRQRPRGRGLASSAFLATHIGAAGGVIGWVDPRTACGTARPPRSGPSPGPWPAWSRITPAAGFVAPMPALLIGLLAGGVCFVAVEIKARLGYDDSLDAVGVHCVGGLVGRAAHRDLREPRR